MPTDQKAHTSGREVMKKTPDYNLPTSSMTRDPKSLGTARANPKLNIPSSNNPSNGMMIQVAPPRTVINAQTGQMVDPISTSQQGEQSEAEQEGGY